MITQKARIYNQILDWHDAQEESIKAQFGEDNNEQV